MADKDVIDEGMTTFGYQACLIPLLLDSHYGQDYFDS
jgi:hypothetical protein